MKLLLLSSSRAGNSDYLAPGLPLIADHLAGITDILFIPYAGVSLSYDHYQQMVQTALAPLGIQVQSIHQSADPRQAVQEAKAIVIGGGNTFQLLHLLYEQQLVQLISDKVRQGTPYIGWSAGSNLAGLSIRTTNDMPIVEPASFTALQLLPCQLNPHYTDFKPEGFHGETRDMRLAEFMHLNPATPIIALPEGSALRLQDDELCYLGATDGYLFIGGSKTAILPGADLSAFM